MPLMPYHEYLMFIPTVFLLLGGMALRMGIWLEESIEGKENATKWEKLKILLETGSPSGDTSYPNSSGI